MEIKIKTGEIVLVDEKDYEKVSKINWFCSKGYATASMYVDGKKINISMHRLIMGLEKGDKRVVDHINHNGLDNRRRNLRVCTSRQNAHNRNMLSSNTSGYKGVSKTVSGSFVANLSHVGHNHYLGTFKTAKEAHLAYCKKAKELHGKFANFGNGSVLIHRKPSAKPSKPKKQEQKQESTYGKINPFWRSSLPEYKK